MTFSFATWLLTLIPMPLVIVLSAIFYIRFRLKNKKTSMEKSL